MLNLQFDLFQALDKNDRSWIPIFFGTLARRYSVGKNSWRDGNGVLLDSHCEQLCHYPSLDLTCFSVVVRERRKPIREY